MSSNKKSQREFKSRVLSNVEIELTEVKIEELTGIKIELTEVALSEQIDPVKVSNRCNVKWCTITNCAEMINSALDETIPIDEIIFICKECHCICDRIDTNNCGNNECHYPEIIESSILPIFSNGK